MVAAIGAIGAVAAAGIGAAASSSAGGAQAAASGNAAAQNLAEFQLNYNTAHPFVDIGQNAGNKLTDLVNSGQMGETPWQYRPAEDALNRLPQNANLPGAPTLPNTPNLPNANLPGAPTFETANLPGAPTLPGAPPPMTQAQLEATPGYQFNLSQGLKAAQSAAAAKGLGVSGAALKGASTYATGLADSTYQNQFNNAQQIYTDLFNNAQTGYTDAFNTGQQRYTDAFNNAQQGYTDAFNTGQQNYSDAFNTAQTGYQNQLQNVQQNYQNQFNTQQQAYNNAFQTNQAQATGFMNLGQAQTNRLNQQFANLLGATAIGSNAAAQLGSQGVTSAANSGNFLTQQGAAQASGLMNTGNALSGGIQNAVNQYQQSNMLQSVLAQQNPLLTNSYASAPGANTNFNMAQTPAYPTAGAMDPTGIGYQPAFLSGASIY